MSDTPTAPPAAASPAPSSDDHVRLAQLEQRCDALEEQIGELSERFNSALRTLASDGNLHAAGEASLRELLPAPRAVEEAAPVPDLAAQLAELQAAVAKLSKKASA